MTATLVAPAYYSVPDFYKTLGPEVGELAQIANFGPDPEQQLILDAMFALDRRGRSAAFEVAVIACRQNLKTGLLKQAAIGKTVIMERPLFVWSAHEFRTAQEAFRDLTILIESCPDLDQLVKRIYRGNGDESIEWLGGQRIIFKARTKSGGRGLTGDDVGLDEAFALLPAHMGALLPTLSARPDPQVMYASSAGLAHSEVLRTVRDRGRAGGDPRLAYIEFCAPDPAEICVQGDKCTHLVGVEGCGCDDPVNWQAGNPALGRRITAEYIAAERRALPAVEFGRERMGWWDQPEAQAAAINLRKWRDLSDPASEMESLAAFAVDVTPDRAFASIGVAGVRADAKVHVELIDHQPGTGWVVAQAVAVNDAQGPLPWVVDPSGPAASLIPELVNAGLEVVELTARELGRVCVWITDAVDHGSLAHGPHPELDDAVKGARRKDVGDGLFRFTRNESTVAISPLMAVTLPCHALLNTLPIGDVTAAYL